MVEEVFSPQNASCGFRGSKKTNNRYFLKTNHMRRRDKRINSIHGNNLSPKALDLSIPSPKGRKDISIGLSPKGSPKPGRTGLIGSPRVNSALSNNSNRVNMITDRQASTQTAIGKDRHSVRSNSMETRESQTSSIEFLYSKY